MIPSEALKNSHLVNGFVDGARVLFMWTSDGLYIQHIEMKSSQVINITNCYEYGDVAPCISIFTLSSLASRYMSTTLIVYDLLHIYIM